MTRLDITTPEGLKIVADQYKASAIFEANFPGWRFVHTSKTEPSPVAGEIYNGSKRIGVAILRCRNMSPEFFERKFNSDWIMTHKKMEVATEICDRERVALIGFLYFKNEQVLAIRTLYDPSKSDPWIEPKVKPPKTMETQATVNGGRDVKPNSMIPMHRAKWLTMPTA